MADQHCSLDSEWPLEDAPMHTLQLIHLFKCVFCIKMVDEHKKGAGILWGHVCYLYILNAPGSSAKHTMSPDSRASSAKSSSSSSSFCCCHGSMPSQVFGAVPPHQNSL